MKILFVCTGNICRSPSAEAVMRHKLEERGLGKVFHVDSAGTHGYHVGEPPDSRAVEAAQRKGISMKGIRARKVTSKDFQDFDYIVAMDNGHYRILENMNSGDSQAKLRLFMNFTEEGKDQDVPDPYYGSLKDFENVLVMLEDGVDQIIKSIEPIGHMPPS
ncbi:MAG TPA: low molecular weight protein-tyrosine-phosphatase [Alphaproteobacteria bacterium]|nr:low molecular weight protein-tyrosine-phosphatase [Alphaproteobacteria bacterium]